MLWGNRGGRCSAAMSCVRMGTEKMLWVKAPLKTFQHCAAVELRDSGGRQLAPLEAHTSRLPTWPVATIGNVSTSLARQSDRLIHRLVVVLGRSGTVREMLTVLTTMEVSARAAFAITRTERAASEAKTPCEGLRENMGWPEHSACQTVVSPGQLPIAVKS